MLRSLMPPLLFSGRGGRKELDDDDDDEDSPPRFRGRKVARNGSGCQMNGEPAAAAPLELEVVNSSAAAIELIRASTNEVAAVVSIISCLCLC